MGYIRQLLATLLVRILLIPVGLLLAVITARWLGPAELGLFAAIGTALLVATQLANVGLPFAATRAAAADAASTGSLVAGARATGALCGLAAMLGVAVWYRVAPQSTGAVPFDLLLLASTALPFSLASAQFQAILLGRQRIRQLNLMEMLNRLSLLVGTVVVLIWLGLGLRELVLLTVGLAVVQYVVYQVLLWPESATWKPDLRVLRGMGGVSIRAYLTLLLYFLVLRSDILLINALLGAEATGIYNVAVLGADSLILLPALAGMILVPRVAADASSRTAELTALLTRHIVFIMAAACLLTALLGWWVVGWLFGAPYQEAAYALWLLLPGVLCLSVQHVLHQDLGGRDYPIYLAGVWGIALTINVALNLLLLPRLGIGGAALASSIAYATAAALFVRYWLRRFPGFSARSLLRLEGHEVRGLWSRFSRSLVERRPERGSA